MYSCIAPNVFGSTILCLHGAVHACHTVSSSNAIPMESRVRSKSLNVGVIFRLPWTVRAYHTNRVCICSVVGVIVGTKVGRFYPGNGECCWAGGWYCWAFRLPSLIATSFGTEVPRLSASGGSGLRLSFLELSRG